MIRATQKACDVPTALGRDDQRGFWIIGVHQVHETIVRIVDVVFEDTNFTDVPSESCNAPQKAPRAPTVMVNCDRSLHSEQCSEALKGNGKSYQTDSHKSVRSKIGPSAHTTRPSTGHLRMIIGGHCPRRHISFICATTARLYLWHHAQYVNVCAQEQHLDIRLPANYLSRNPVQCRSVLTWKFLAHRRCRSSLC